MSEGQFFSQNGDDSVGGFGQSALQACLLLGTVYQVSDVSMGL